MSRKTTVLVVEDNLDHQNLIKLVLARELVHVHVDCVIGGEAAQTYLQEEGTPALIVLDHWLPDMTGLQLLEWLDGEERLAAAPVIMFTSSEDPEHAQRAYALGVRRYLIKPADFNELVVAVKETLDHWVDPASDSAKA